MRFYSYRAKVIQGNSKGNISIMYWFLWEIILFKITIAEGNVITVWLPKYYLCLFQWNPYAATISGVFHSLITKITFFPTPAKF